MPPNDNPPSKTHEALTRQHSVVRTPPIGSTGLQWDGDVGDSIVTNFAVETHDEDSIRVRYYNLRAKD